MAFLPRPDNDADWHALRLRHVGGSEIAALFGLQARYGLSYFGLYQIKSGAVAAPPVDGDRVEAGNLFEDAIVTWGARRYGWTVYDAVYASDDECPGLGATLDRLIDAGPDEIALGMTGRGVCEAKNVDREVFMTQWVNDEPPFHILLQLQHQLACSGMPWGCIVAVVGGNELRCWRYWADPALIDMIRKAVTKFWSDIREGREPDVDGAESTAAILRSLYPEVLDDGEVDMSANNEWAETVADFLAAGKAKRAANDEYDLTKNRLVKLLGSTKRARGGGYVVSVVVTPEKAERPARPGEMISGRVETRRYNAKEIAA